MSSEGRSPSVKRATAYRYGSTTIIVAHFIEKENIFLSRVAELMKMYQQLVEKEK